MSPIPSSSKFRTKQDPKHNSDTKPVMSNALSVAQPLPSSTLESKINATPSESNVISRELLQMSNIHLARSNSTTTHSQNSGSNPVPAIPKYTHHPRHYHFDSSIIIHMGQSEFKLYRGALVRARTGMARKTENLTASNVVASGTVPTCALDGIISKEDFVGLLDALEDAIGITTSGPPSFTNTISILRASYALVFTKFYNWSKMELEKMWGIFDEPVSVPSLRPSVKLGASQSTETIIVARTCNVQRVICPALYKLFRSEEFGRPLSTASASGPAGKLKPLRTSEHGLSTSD
ncbi:hypothetical protein J3R30DRAFT_3709992 [Lentinula aciculospora]|uniref:BTB domain-containing protein n=1 Tax=Lentinula aciculospora TaxID=153920 RepID=A0A9W9A0C5_9AGAR|nr:hypothetical protein J3R30DRAFT_3709992 [Lentinula aciculospora]